jgi:hypothetical protein
LNENSLMVLIEKIMNGFVAFYEYEYEELIAESVIQSRVADDPQE